MFKNGVLTRYPSCSKVFIDNLIGDDGERDPTRKASESPRAPEPEAEKSRKTSTLYKMSRPTISVKAMTEVFLVPKDKWIGNKGGTTRRRRELSTVDQLTN